MTLLNVDNRSKEDSLINLRENGIIPGVIFGGGFSSEMITMPESKLIKFVGGSGSVYEIKSEGKASNRFVMFDEVQKDPVNGKLVHFSLKVLTRGEKTTVEVPILFTGTEQKSTDKGLYVTLLETISVEGIPSKMPKKINVDLSRLELGESYTVKDLCDAYDISVDNSEETVLAQYQYLNAEKNEVDASGGQGEGIEVVTHSDNENS